MLSNRRLSILCGFIILAAGASVFSGPARAQSQVAEHARVIVPNSTVEHPEDIGKKSHTNYLILYQPAKGGGGGPAGEMPLSLSCVYQTWATSLFSVGCPYSSSTASPSGGFGIIASIVGGQRGVPDLSFDANPSTGVSVYDTMSRQGMSGWMVFGGTSVSSPSLAGIVNWAGSHYSSTNTELTNIYGCYATGSCNSANFRDITSGSKAGSFSPQVGWDFITGVGSSLGATNK